MSFCFNVSSPTPYCSYSEDMLLTLKGLPALPSPHLPSPSKLQPYSPEPTVHLPFIWSCLSLETLPQSLDEMPPGGASSAPSPSPITAPILPIADARGLLIPAAAILVNSEQAQSQCRQHPPKAHTLRLSSAACRGSSDPAYVSEALPGHIMGVHAIGDTLMEDRGCGHMAQPPVLTQAILGGPLNASQKFW